MSEERNTAGRTPNGLELQRLAEEGADDPTSAFIRGETNELHGDGGEWELEDAIDFLDLARALFPGSHQEP